MEIVKIYFNDDKNEENNKKYGCDVLALVRDNGEEEHYKLGTLTYGYGDEEGYEDEDFDGWVFWQGEGYTDYDYIDKYFNGSMEIIAIEYPLDLEGAKEDIREEYMQNQD